MTVPPEQVIDAWIDAWNSRDLATLGALTDEEGVRVVIPTSTVAIGYRVEASVAFFHNISSDCRLTRKVTIRGEAVDLYIDKGQLYGLEWEVEGTNDAPIEPFGLPPTGNSFLVRGMSLVWIDDGRFKLLRSYWDLLGLLVQLGVELPEAIAKGIETRR